MNCELQIIPNAFLPIKKHFIRIRRVYGDFPFSAGMYLVVTALLKENNGRKEIFSEFQIDLCPSPNDFQSNIKLLDFAVFADEINLKLICPTIGMCLINYSE